MVDQIAVVTFDIDPGTVPYTLNITSPSITETFTAAVLMSCATGTDDSDEDHGIMGLAFIAPDTGNSPSFTDMSRSSIGESGGTVVVDARHLNSTSLIRIQSTSAGTSLVEFAYSASISGGFSVSVTKAPASTVKMTAVIFAGLTRGTLLELGLAGSQNIGGSSLYEPDLIITSTTFDSEAIGVNVLSQNGIASIGFGVNDINLSQVSAYVDIDNGTGTSPNGVDGDAHLSSDSFRTTLNSGRSGTVQGQITSFDSTGITHTVSSATIRSHALALKFSGDVQFQCANIAVSGSTGDQTFTDFGFAPDLVLGMSHFIAAEDTLEDGAAGGSAGYFVTGVHGERAYTYNIDEGQVLSGGNPSNCGQRQEDVGVLTYDDTGTVAQRATWVGASGSGFTLNFSVATAGWLTALGIKLEQQPLVTEESVSLSDGAVLLLEETLVGDTEQVLISDASATTFLDGTMTGPDTVNRVRGWTDQGGAISGKTEIGGPEELGGS